MSAIKNGAALPCKQARPNDELLCEMLDSRLPKTEREHAAAREIERLRAEVEGWKGQHMRDSAELRRLCQHRDEYKARAERLAEALRQISIRANSPDGSRAAMDRHLTEIMDICAGVIREVRAYG